MRRLPASAFRMLSCLLIVFSHADEVMVGKGVPGITVGTDLDIFSPLLLTCLIQNF